MKITTVNSGSSGNSYLIESGESFLALDAGCKMKEVQIACGFKTANIKACLVTHKHG